MKDDSIRQTADRLAQVISLFREFDPKMELGQLLIFLYVAAQPGIQMKELERLTGLTKSAMSRNVKALSDRSYLTDEAGDSLPGHHLVSSAENPFNRRSLLVSATGAGRAAMVKVARLLNQSTLPKTT